MTVSLLVSLDSRKSQNRKSYRHWTKKHCGTACTSPEKFKRTCLVGASFLPVLVPGAYFPNTNLMTNFGLNSALNIIPLLRPST